MTLTQLNAFVLVARLGSVTAAASALGVSEPAVSQALTALRQHLGDQLITRGPAGMTLTPGGSRLLATASQIVVLGAEAHAAVRAAQGAPEQLRIVATSTFGEFVASPLVEAFTRRFPGPVEVSTGVAVSSEQAVLVANRLADVAFGAGVARDPALPVVSEPIFKYRVVVVTAGQARPRGPARQWRWLVDPSGADPGSETGQLLAALRRAGEQHRGVPEPDRGLGGGRRRRRGGTRDRAPGRPAAAAGRAVTGRCARPAGGGVLVRDLAGAAASQHGRERAAPLPRHPRGHAADAVAGGRGAAVAVPATGVRHHMELSNSSGHLVATWRSTRSTVGFEPVAQL